MKRVGIVICNYNKAQMVTECIQAVLEQTYTDYDLYVVDNASEDDSVERIKDAFGSALTLLVNSENLGGSGGFNTGLKLAYKKGHEYLMCVDNDAFLDENALKELVKFLDDHSDCGMAASKIYHLENPGVVQNYGQKIDFESFSTEAYYYGHEEDGSMPDFMYVDAVPACSLLVRRQTVDKIGFLPEKNFLYWDDTEWAYKCNLKGMKVASVGSSKALHSMGAKREDVTTFPTYYAWRNWIYFFIKYTPEKDLVRMALMFISSVFNVQYEGYLRDEVQKAATVMAAYDDAIHDNMGKGDASKYGPVDKNETLGEDDSWPDTTDPEYIKANDLFCYSNLPMFLRCADKIRACNNQ